MQADAHRTRIDLRPEAAEALGVFLLILMGCGAIMVNAESGALGHLGVSLVFGFTILLLVYALAPICGAHYNPAVTIAFAATGHFPWQRVPSYIAAQTLGATAAALVLRLLLGDSASLGATAVAPNISIPAAFAWEFLATFVLALVIVGVATDRRAAPGSAGLAIGLAVAVGSLVVGPLTGAAMNPARSIGPALVSGSLDHLWIYIAAPVLGAVAAMAAFELLRPGRVPGKVLGVTGPFNLQPGDAR